MPSSYILFIASWYPDQSDPTLGIFIRRHAEAVALYKHVKVLYMKKGNRFGIIKRTTGNIEEIEVTYRDIIPKLSMYFAFMKAAMQLIHQAKPEVIHAHVTIPAGYLAKRLSDKTDIPYIITEHWTGYHPKDGNYKGFLLKLLTSKAIYNASFITPVSIDLMLAMKKHQLLGKYKVIPNVADPVFFNTSPNKSIKRFLHVSSLDERQKNISGLLRAFRLVQQDIPDAELLIAGDGPDRNKAEIFCKENKIKNVFFKGNLDAKQLADLLSESASLVLFSNFENLPCVIIEALATGTPVISTDVGGIREIVNKENGILIKAEDESSLADAMKGILQHPLFDKYKIREAAYERFSYENVGNVIMDMYSSLKK